MFGSVPAELVWYVSDSTGAYDTLLYRAMATEYHIAEAFAGRPHEGLWLSDRHLDARWEPFERAAMALLGTCCPL